MLQYKKKKSWRSFFLTILVLIALIVLSHRNPEASRFNYIAVNTVLNTLQRGF